MQKRGPWEHGYLRDGGEGNGLLMEKENEWSREEEEPGSKVLEARRSNEVNFWRM